MLCEGVTYTKSLKTIAVEDLSLTVYFLNYSIKDQKAQDHFCNVEAALQAYKVEKKSLVQKFDHEIPVAQMLNYSAIAVFCSFLKYTLRDLTV